MDDEQTKAWIDTMHDFYRHTDPDDIVTKLSTDPDHEEPRKLAVTIDVAALRRQAMEAQYTTVKMPQMVTLTANELLMLLDMIEQAKR